MITIQYKTKRSTGPCTVEGFQVGRFAIRARHFEPFMIMGPDGRDFPSKAWIIDHWPSSMVVLTVDTFAEAAVVADDLSRFSAEDPDSPVVQQLVAQMGKELLGWATHLAQGGEVVPFRQWKEGRSVPGLLSEPDLR